MAQSFFLLLLVMCPLVHAEPVTILVEYRDKPPYSYTDAGKPAGFLLLRTIEIFRQAGVNAVFKEIPTKRITDDIQSNHAAICSPSWYKLPEREVFAKFSESIHQDKPQVILAGRDAAAAIRAKKTIKALLADKSWRLGVIDGLSLGAELEAAILNQGIKPSRFTMTPIKLVQMIANHRDADYMFIDREDFDYLNRDKSIAAMGVVPIEMADSPAGLKRYLMCSKMVDDATLDRLNKAIGKVMRSVKQ